MKFKAGMFFSLLVCMASSCLNTDEIVYEEDVKARNAQILSLSLAHDSVPELAKTRFSINQITGEVYNHDSLPYGTDFSKLYPFADSIRVKVTYTTVYSYAGMRAEADTLTWIASGDSLTVVPNVPILFNIYALYGVKKQYTLSVNVHEIDPDSVQYQLFTGEVPAALPPPAFAVPEPLPAHFPTDDYSVVALKFGTVEQIMLIGGNSNADVDYTTVWATQDGGQTWLELSINPGARLPKIDGGNAFPYNNEIWFINGTLADGDPNMQVYYSLDRGLTWRIKPSKANPPRNFTNAEVRVDAEGRYFYIIGSDGTVWRAALNARL